MKNYQIKIIYFPDITLDISEHEFSFTVTYKLSFTDFNVRYYFRDISELKNSVKKELANAEMVLKKDFTYNTQEIAKNLRKMLKKL